MGIYVVTGGRNGIGRSVVETLQSGGNTVYSIDYEGGDVVADLSIPEARQEAIRRIYALCPDGIDGLACIAGIAGPKGGKNSPCIGVNYYSSIRMAEGLFPLLEKRRGACVMTASGSIAWGRERAMSNFVDCILDCEDEARVCALADSFPLFTGPNMYFASKLAVAKWARRSSTEWGLRGVRLCVVAPGCVDTRLGVKPEGVKVNESFHMTIPMYYQPRQEEEHTIPPRDLGEAITFLLSDRASGCAGSIFYVDAGQEAFYHPDKLYY